MLSIPSFDSVRSIGQFLHDSNYNAPALSGTFGLEHGLHSNLDNLEALLYKTQGDSPLAVLARLFFVAVPVETSLLTRVVPQDVLSNALACRLLKQDNGQFRPSAIILPFSHLLLAADTAQGHGADANRVMGASASTKLISNFTLREPVSTLLDIGTGGGVLGLEAAAYSRDVVGIDINERAIELARFNAALNGISNIEFAAGDAFAPVAGRRFDRIIANPPFFITSAKKFTYSDSPIELDGFSRLLAKEAPQYLEEGGFFQMLCEWVQIEGQPWTARLQEWTEGSGCDAMVIQGPQQTPVDYAEKRFGEAQQLYPKDIITPVTERLAFFKQAKVEKIIGGLVFMRKRQGANWFSTLVTTIGSGSPGPAIRDRFESVTFAGTHSPADLLNVRLRLADDAGIDERKVLDTDGRWKVVSAELTKGEGFRDKLGLDSVVAGFVGLFDGSRTVAEIAGAASNSLGWPEEEARSRCLSLARRLLQSSFVKPVVSQ